MKPYLCAAVLSLASLGFAESTPPLEVVTEDFPPFQFLSNGQLQGPAATLVRNALDNAEFKETPILVYPWAYAYRQAESRANTLIFSMVRIGAREDKFKWIAEVGKMRIGVFKLKSRKDIVIESDQDLRKYSIATFIDSAPAHYLANKEFENVIQVSNNDSLAPMLMRGRVDLVPGSVHSIYSAINERGFDPNDVEVVYYIEELDKNLWAAMSLETSDELVTKMRNAFSKAAATSPANIIELPLPSFTTTVPE